MLKMRSLLLISMFLVSAAVAQTDVVKHIYCYVCDSETTENCGDGESIDSFQQLNCTEDIGDTCFKSREEDPDGNEIFTRGCVYSADYDGETDYCDTATLYSTATTMCVCQEDFCNAANSSNLVNYFLTAVTLMATIKLLR